MSAELIQRLLEHRTLGAVPREQLEWLASRATLLRLAPGEEFWPHQEPIRHLIVFLSGSASIAVDHGAGPRKVMQWHGGDIGGTLPFSRLGAAPGPTTVEEPTEILTVDRDHFPDMISRCQELTGTLVHVMLDRARHFTTSSLQDEKMLSLGRLSAGLAHELNNPASALARSAGELSARIFELEASALVLGAANLSEAQLAELARVRADCGDARARMSLTPLERAEREDALDDWLARRGVKDDIAESLTETVVAVESLDRLAATLPADALEFALRSIGASCRARRLAAEVETAAARVHGLVAAVKGFTYMDQHHVRQPVEIGQGLSDTLTILAGKARQKNVTLTVEVAADLPRVEGFGGELNQVWANLIDNAIDATPESGKVTVTARRQGDSVVVRVADDGPGVPSELREKIFDPFFTTKPQGQGTGLGLDIARRVVRGHNGSIEVDSRPGRTEFRVILPRA